MTQSFLKAADNRFLIDENGLRITISRPNFSIPLEVVNNSLVALGFSTVLDMSQESGEFTDIGPYGGNFSRLGDPQRFFIDRDNFQVLDGDDSARRLDSPNVPDSIMNIMSSGSFTIVFAFSVDSYSQPAWRVGTGEIQNGAPIFGSVMSKSGQVVTGASLSIDEGVIRYKVGSGQADDFIIHAYASTISLQFGVLNIGTIIYDGQNQSIDFFINGEKLNTVSGEQDTSINDLSLGTNTAVPAPSFTQINPQPFYVGSSSVQGMANAGLANGGLKGCVGVFGIKDTMLDDNQVLNIHRNFSIQESVEYRTFLVGSRYVVSPFQAVFTPIENQIIASGDNIIVERPFLSVQSNGSQFFLWSVVRLRRGSSASLIINGSYRIDRINGFTGSAINNSTVVVAGDGRGPNGNVRILPGSNFSVTRQSDQNVESQTLASPFERPTSATSSGTYMADSNPMSSTRDDETYNYSGEVFLEWVS